MVRRIAFAALVLLALVGSVGAVRNAAYVYFGAVCPPEFWANELGQQIAEVVDVAGFEPEESAGSAWGVADCDSKREVGVSFASDVANSAKVFHRLEAAYGQLGWRLVDGEPWWGCQEKLVLGIPAQSVVGWNPDERRYSVAAALTLGLGCNGGKYSLAPE